MPHHDARTVLWTSKRANTEEALERRILERIT
jgi:hypothetical protein